MNANPTLAVNKNQNVYGANCLTNLSPAHCTPGKLSLHALQLETMPTL